MRKKLFCLLTGIMAIAFSGAAAADVLMYDEDFGDRLTYPDGSPAIQLGDISGQNPWDYDTYAYPPLGTEFYEIWDATQGDGWITNIGGTHQRVLQTWYTGSDEQWGKTVHNSFMNMFRPDYQLPLVVEFKFRPAYYDPHPTVQGPYTAAAQDPSYEYKEMACKFRFHTDSPTGVGGYRMRYSLYYDGSFWQSFREQGFPGSAGGGPEVDLGGKDGGGYNIWDATKNGVGEWLEYRLVNDPVRQEVRVYLGCEDNPLTPVTSLIRDANGDPYRDANGNILLSQNGAIWDAARQISEYTVEPGTGLGADETLLYVRCRQIGELQGGADQTAAYSEEEERYIGDANWDGSKASYDDIRVCYLGTARRVRRISGTFTIEYPYWCYYKLEKVGWQLRPPAGGGGPKKPLQEGVEDFQLWYQPVNKYHASYAGTVEPNIPIVRDFTIGLVEPGTYDASFKHNHRLAFTVSNLAVSSTADATGIKLTLFAGDVSGDFINFRDALGNPIVRTDNDCDSWDLATLSTEFNGTGYPYNTTLPLAMNYRGQSGDLDNDSRVTTWDQQAVIAGQGQKGASWRYTANIQGKATIKYPGWLWSFVKEVYYQVRNPATPPTTPIYSGELLDDPDFLTCVKMSNPGTISFGLAIPGIKGGTYDLAIKHHNHIADVVQMVIPSTTGVVTGLWCSALWAGDADGDNNVNTVYPTDKTGDNDVDLKDRYTITYQYNGTIPVCRGYNSDFNGDGTVGLLDYNGMKYGYTNRAAPGNWWK